MPNYNAIVNVTNCFNAATKIKSMELGDVRSGTALKKLYNSPELLSQTLKTITDAVPANKHRSDINIHDRIDKGTKILSTYHELNSKISNKRGLDLKSKDIIEVARIVKPIMQDKVQLNIDKILQIYEILSK